MNVTTCPRKAAANRVKLKSLAGSVSFVFGELVAMTKTGGAVDALEHQSPAQEFIAFAVRRLIEYRVHLEIGFLVANRRFDTVAIFKKKEISRGTG